jgi:hypothetical protein
MGVGTSVSATLELACGEMTEIAVAESTWSDWDEGEPENGPNPAGGVWLSLRTVVGGNELEGDMSDTTGATVPLDEGGKTCKGIDEEAAGVETGSELAINEIVGELVVPCVVIRVAPSHKVANRPWPSRHS